MKKTEVNRRSLLKTAAAVAACGITLPTSAETPSDEEQATYTEFKKLIEQYFAACNSMSVDEAMAFYAKDPGLVFYDLTPPLKFNGWYEYREGIKKAYLHKVLHAHLSPNDDLRVTQRGNLAWTTETFRFSVTRKTGEVVDLQARHTAIWEKRGAKWIIVHEHCSIPYSG